MPTCYRHTHTHFMHNYETHSAQAQAIPIRLLDGTDVMTMAEYSLWWDELGGQEAGDCFFNTGQKIPSCSLAFGFSFLSFFGICVFTHEVVLSFYGP